MEYESMEIIGRAKRVPHWGVQSRFRVIYICRYVWSVVCQINCVGGITWTKHAHAQSQVWGLKPTCDTRAIHLDYYASSSFRMD